MKEVSDVSFMKTSHARSVIACIMLCLCIIGAVSPVDAALVRGAISVFSEPEGASIYLNDEDLGMQTNTVIENVFPGIHYIRLEKPGYRTWETIFEVSEGKITYVSHTMEPMTGGPLSVVTTPKGAGVYIDGTLYGLSDIDIYDLPAGQHRLLLTLDTYADYAATITIPEGMAQSLVHTFEPAPTTGRVTFFSAPSNAAIYMDGVYQGETSLTLEDVIPGTYTVVMAQTGYENWTGTVEVGAGKISEVTAVLVRSPVRLTVTSLPPDADVFIDGVFRGTTPLETLFEQGEYTLLIEKFGYEPYEEVVVIGPAGVPVSVTLVSMVPQALAAAERAVSENRAYNTKNAENALQEAGISYAAGDAEAAIRYAESAIALATDVDRDGVVNPRDISPHLHNGIIYAMPVLLLILVAGLFVFDRTRHRVRPEIILHLPVTVREDDMLARADVTVDATGGPYRAFVCTVSIDGVPVDRFTDPGKYEVMLAGRGRGVHQLRIYLQVAKKRYGTAETITDQSFIIEPVERVHAGDEGIIDADASGLDVAVLYEEKEEGDGPTE